MVQLPLTRTSATAESSRDERFSTRSRVQKHPSGSAKDTQNETRFESFFRGKTADEVDTWMEAQAKNVTMQMQMQIPLDKECSSRDETNFIRSLRDHKAYRAIDIFTRHLARNKNVFVYTAAIASLATAEEEYQETALQLLDDMAEHNVRPSPHTFAALFQASNRPEKLRSLQTRLKREYPGVIWTLPVWEAAIYACSRGPGNWTMAQELIAEMKQESLFLSAQTYLALFQVCSANANALQAVEILRYLLQADAAPVAVSPRIWGAALQVCAIAGDHVSARTILSWMQELGHRANVRHCTAYLKALAVSRQDRVALAFLEYMVHGQDIDTGQTTISTSPWDGLLVDLPDAIVLQAVLTALSTTENYTQSRRLLDKIKNGDFGDNVKVDENHYNLVLASCREPQEAKVLIREMRLSRRHRVGVVAPSQITYTRAITVCRKAADMKSALFFLNQSRDDAILPDVYMYSAVIWTAARAGDCESAFRILQEMKDSDCLPNIISFNGVITALATCDRADDAVAIYEEIIAKDISPTLSTYQSLSGAIRKVKELDDKIGLLTRVFNHMGANHRRTGVGGSVLESLICAYAGLGRYDDAKRVFDSIEGPTDVALLRAMLFACSQASPPEWQEATSLLDAITKKEGRVDSGSLCKAMLACSKANAWAESLELLRRFGSNETSIVAFNSLIGACGRGRRPDMAMEILNDMEDSYGVRPDSRSYRNAIIACNQAEHEKRREERRKKKKRLQEDAPTRTQTFEWWECAVSLLRRMQEHGLRADTQTFSSAISACEAAGQWQRALGILQSMLDVDEKGNEDESSVLNQYCFNAAISACEKAGAWVEALEIYERMKEQGGSLEPTMVTLSSLVLALDKAGQKEIAQSFYKEGVQRKIVNPWRFTRDQNDEKVRAMDLHKFSAAMARAAVRSHFENMLMNARPIIADDLIIIVGKGLRSTEEPVLMPAVQKLLEHEYGIEAKLQANNRGRLVVEADALRAFVTTKSWR
jgi:pentatricopeptide repeat domain-containing protein 1